MVSKRLGLAKRAVQNCETVRFYIPRCFVMSNWNAADRLTLFDLSKNRA